MPTSTPHRARAGFTLIELMFVVLILAVLSVVAVGAYTSQVRKAHRTEVMSDLAGITMREKSFLAVNGHYASTAVAEGINTVYPAGATITAAKGEVEWNINDAEFLGTGLGDTAFSIGGGDVHGFDAMRFMPEGGRSYCGYAVISGYGNDAPDPADASVPPGGSIADDVFPAATAAAFIARDWFYAYALCDFDYDGTYWAFSTAHYTSEINSDSTTDGTYLEGE